jgi:putative flippase GtrA
MNPSKLLETATGRYITVGGSVYVLELIVIYIAGQAGASQIVSVALSFWIGLVVSFVLQKLFTFQDKRTHKRLVVKQFMAVCVLVLFNFGFTIAVTKLLEGKAPAAVSRTVALGITTLWNFYLYKTRIFKAEEIIPVD